jgi:hypothetical protein
MSLQRVLETMFEADRTLRRTEAEFIRGGGAATA